MATAYFDCFAGAGGDMIVASLIDAGADLADIKAALSKLDMPGFDVRAERAARGGISGLQFSVETSGEQTHRRLSDILSMIDAASLPPRAADRATRIFHRLGEAEAKVHGIDIEKVHFHEVGAVDSIVDVVGACIALELLDIDRVQCGPITLGSGTVKCDHGTLPVPAPAVAELVVGFATTGTDLPGECTTPTAAAVLTTLAETCGPMSDMNVTAVGYGAGTREGGPLPNVLRVFIGDDGDDDEKSADTVVELSANIDDCSGEIIGATIDALLAGGCLDAWACPVVMKKSRPAWMLSALCRPGAVAAAEEIIFSETSTFGIRRHLCHRSKLQRQWQSVETRFGPVRMKIGRMGENVVTTSPEFDDCAAAARSHGVAVREVFAAAEAVFREGDK